MKSAYNHENGCGTRQEYAESAAMPMGCAPPASAKPMNELIQCAVFMVQLPGGLYLRHGQRRVRAQHRSRHLWNKKEKKSHQPKPVGERPETAGHDQMTQFVTRKRLHMQYPPDPLDKWIARDIQLSPEGDYVDNTTGEALSTEEREEYERYQRRFHKRCKLGGKADRLVRIVDRYMPRIAEENRIFVMRFPDKVEKMFRSARGIRRKIRARRRQQQGEAAAPPKDEPPEVLRPANMGEDEEQCNDERYVEDTPPDWGDSHEDLNMAETQGSDQQSSKGEEADSPAMAVGSRGETFRHRKRSRSARRKARRTGET